MLAWENIEVKSAAVVEQLARHFKCLGGKWMVFPKVKTVDSQWKRIVNAILTGKLSARSAKVSTPNVGKHVICIYTEDFTNSEQVMNVRQQLKEVGFTCRLLYKADAYTYLNIYSDNKWKIKPTIYSEQKLFQLINFSHDDDDDSEDEAYEYEEEDEYSEYNSGEEEEE